MFDKLLDFFLDSKHKFSKKFLMTFLVIVGLLAIDYFFRFSDSYIAEKKIEQLGNIQEIIKQDTLRIELKNELIRIEKEVIKRQGFWSSLSDLTSFIQRTISSPKQIITKPIATKPIKIEIKEKTIPERDVFWHIISSCWIFILIMLIIPISPFYDKANNLTFGVAIIMEVIMIFFCGFYSYLLALVPIFEYPFWNYTINVLSFPLVILLFGAISSKNK
jgi:hypothetical protein